MVLKLLVLMVAVAVLEGVAGLQEKQFANETQIKANPDHKKRGRRLDKLPCIMEQGTCQRIDDYCDGIVRKGAEWCLHHRHFECCYPRGCSMDDTIYPNGAIAERSCMIFICVKGDWQFDRYDESCGICCTYNTTDIVTYVDHDINSDLISHYSIRGYDGPFSFSQYGYKRDSHFGIDITLVSRDPHWENNVDCILYYEYEITVEIWCWDYPTVWVSMYSGIPFPVLPETPLPSMKNFGSVFIIWIGNDICIIGSLGLTVCVSFPPPPLDCPMTVCAYASPSLNDNLYGLCGEWIPIPPDNVPLDFTMLKGVETTRIDDFVTSWKYPLQRSAHSHDRKNPSSDHSGQLNKGTIIERSMSEIEQLCEEMNEGPCTILPFEECEQFKETCVSRISDSQE